MSDEEETLLLGEYEKNRIVILESILKVPRGREMVLSPILLLAGGGESDVEILDPHHWHVADGSIPQGRRSDLKGLIDRLGGPYLNRSAVRELHFLWHTVEDIGRELFRGVEEYRRLLLMRSEIASRLGNDVNSLELLSTSFDILDGEIKPSARMAWRLHPMFFSIQNRLALLEVTTGTDIVDFSDSEKRYTEAMSRIADIVERFVEANLGLVISKVRRYHPCDVMEEMDLVQEGCQGLMEAVRRFDPSRGFKLSTYAVWWIRQYVMKAIIKHDRLVRVPVSVRDRDIEIRRAMESFSHEHGRTPTMEELSEYLGHDISDIEDVYISTAPSLSLDHTGPEQDATLAEFLESRLQTPERAALSSDVIKRISGALNSLSDREKTIITLRYGLMDSDPCTLQELGRVFGISRERVRQIESRALSKLRNHGLIAALEMNEE